MTAGTNIILSIADWLHVVNDMDTINIKYDKENAY